MILGGKVNWRDIVGAPWWSWATVTQVSPLQVRLDGDDDPLDVPPGNELPGLVVGDRVWCQVTGRQLVLLRQGGSRPLPLPVSWQNPDMVTVTATEWSNVPAGGTVSIALTAPALVQVTFSGWLDVAATAKDLRVCASWSGASSGSTFGLFSWRGVLYRGPDGYTSASLTLPLVLPAGTTTFRTQAYAVGTNPDAPRLNYAGGTITPIHYV